MRHKSTLFTLMTTATLTILVLTAALSTTACLWPLDSLGVESKEYERESLFREPEIEDDIIEDKNLVCDPSLTTAVYYGQCGFNLNMSCSVTRLDVVEYPEGSQKDLLDGMLFPTRGAALARMEEAGGDTIPSMEVVNGALKPFNDGLYAAIETSVQQGLLHPVDATQIYPSKRQFLLDLAGALITADASATPDQQTHLRSGLVFVLGSLLAAGADVTPLNADAGLVSQAQGAADDFSAQLLTATPMGFYTWSDTLREIFIQDRFLQNRANQRDNSEAELGRFAAMAAVIEDATPLRGPYERYLALYAGLSNPYSSYAVADLFPYVDGVASLSNMSAIRTALLADHGEPYVCNGTWFALFPASRARDTDYLNETFCNEDPPADVNLIDVLVNSIRERLLDLEPDETSGWYDYQLYALETLLVPESLPESDNLLLTKAYKEKLIETFQSLITQTRETHAKQLETFGGVGVSAPPTPVDLYPKFPLEPFPSFYLRTARAYRFLETLLPAALGSEFLAHTTRMTEDGAETTVALGEELADITRLLYGLYIASAQSVGLDWSAHLLADELSPEDFTAATNRADTWLETWKQDVDIRRDPRVIVPVGQLQTGEILYWAVLGVKVYRINARFVEGYEPRADPIGDYCELRDHVDHDYLLLVEEMQEVRMGETVAPLTREEYRQICDQYDNASDIVAALEAL
jgi:hypothetical protein